MIRPIVRSVLAPFAAILAAGPLPGADEAEPQLAHMVFFTLKDHSTASREAFVASCQKYLSGHEGAVSFSVGVIAEDVEEPVSVRDFDVALHLIFVDKAAEKSYIEHPRHKGSSPRTRTPSPRSASSTPTWRVPTLTPLPGRWSGFSWLGWGVDSAGGSKKNRVPMLGLVS